MTTRTAAEPAVERTIERIAAVILASGAAPWQFEAACADVPDLMADPGPGRVFEALSRCSQCPVTEQCSDWADDEPEYLGVAAGAHRGRLRRRDRLAG